jgi:hypothetical protein
VSATILRFPGSAIESGLSAREISDIRAGIASLPGMWRMEVGMARNQPDAPGSAGPAFEVRVYPGRRHTLPDRKFTLAKVDGLVDVVLWADPRVFTDGFSPFGRYRSVGAAIEAIHRDIELMPSFWGISARA